MDSILELDNMRQKTVVETSDGGTHDTLKDAQKHLDNQYGNLLTSLTHKLVVTDLKYLALMDFVEAHLDDFVKLKALKIEAENYTDEEGNEFVLDDKKIWRIR